MIILANLLA